MKILITGAAGMLGSALVKELCPDFEIAGIDIKETPSRTDSGLNFFRGDITRIKEIAGTVREVAPDLVIHTAAFTDVDGCERAPAKAQRVNAFGSRNVALAAKRSGSTLVYISTDFIFDGGSNKPYREEDTPNPLNIYGRTKLEGEQFVRSIVPRNIIVRTSWLFGRGGKNFVDTIITKAEKGEELKVVTDQRGCSTYVVDLAAAIKKLIKKRVVGLRDSEKEEAGISDMFHDVYHISNDGKCSWYELAERALEYAGISVPVTPIMSEEYPGKAKRPEMSVLNCERYGKLADGLLRPWPEALKEYIENRIKN